MLAQPQELRWSDKAPQDFLDYAIDWGSVLEMYPGDTIVQASWEVPPGLTFGDSFIVGPYTIIFLGAGVAGTQYQVKCQITTSGGRVLKRTVRLGVKNL